MGLNIFRPFVYVYITYRYAWEVVKRRKPMENGVLAFYDTSVIYINELWTGYGALPGAPATKTVNRSINQSYDNIYIYIAYNFV